MNNGKIINWHKIKRTLAYISSKLQPPSGLARLAGGGGSGELAGLFSGLGEPKFATELAALEDDAIHEMKKINVLNLTA